MPSTLTLPPRNRIHFDDRGLVPVVVQDDRSGDVLMLAYANAQALDLTAETGQAHFWSRSRGKLWKKGERSGHTLSVRSIHSDCDGDAILYVVDPEPPTCHKGTRTCFGDAPVTSAGVVGEVERVVSDRKRRPVDGSYTSRLLGDSGDLALKKLGEEATEVILAAKGESDERLAEEAADLLYHLTVVLQRRGVDLRAPYDVLRKRRRRRPRP